MHNQYYHSKSKHYFQRYLAGLLPDDHFKVLCCCIEKHEEKDVERYQEITDQRIEYLSFPNFRELKSYFAIYQTLRKNIQTADFCYIRTGISGIIAAHFCRKYHIPYMFIVNEDLEANLKTNKRKLVRNGASVVGILTRRYIRKANYACYVTNHYLQNRYPCKGEMLGCSDIENLTIEDAVRRDYLSRNKNPADLVIGTAGPVDTALKGHDVVFHAMKTLRDKGIHLTYQLVGSGDPKRLEAIASDAGVFDSVVFLGEKSRDGVLDWMRGLDLYIQPSRSEGLPRSIVEAMVNALPCIASDVGGIPELIPKKYLFHHDANAANTIASIIAGLGNDELNEMSNTNFSKAKAYDPLILDEKRKAFFTRAITETRKRQKR